MALHITCVTSRAELESSRSEWDGLWMSMRDRTPFQHSAWLFPWWDVFGPGELRVMTFRDGRRLVGILPLYATAGRAGIELRLIGAGNSDYLDMLVAPDAREAVLAELPVAFEGCPSDWTSCDLDHLREGSLLLKGYGAANTISPEDPTAVMGLPSRIEQLPDIIGAKLASNLRNRRRRAECIGSLTVETASGSSLQSDLTALFDLHGTRWKQVEQPGVLADPLVRRFHRLSAAAMDRAGLLRLLTVRVGERFAAVQYGFQVDDRAYLYIGGFDPLLSTISPGKLSVFGVIEQAVADGAVTLDFLGGREAYKYEWGATDRPRFRCHLRRTTRDVNSDHPHLPA